jgi:hypothetical protein
VRVWSVAWFGVKSVAYGAATGLGKKWGGGVRGARMVVVGGG